MRLLLISLFFFVAGCSLTEKDETLTWSAQKIYNEAKTSMDKGSLTKARTYYGKLLSRFPFGRYAQQSGLDLIQLEYKDKEYDKATAQADKFIRLYPQSQHADYARYMKGVIAYSRDVSMLDKLIPTNIAQSDQSMMRKAYQDFAELTANSPNGEYSEDAKMRMVFLRNISAEHEIYVAEYYMRRGAFLAAANRGQYVVSQYSRTPAVALGLAVMVRSYTELNMPKLAADAKRILDKNYPDAVKNPRIDFVLNGDVRTKPGFLSKLRRGLLTK
ncbi:MAG: outer membrane protein assembly factor BamD [Gammaproteobacteria bacterium]|nr:outer membrane protein assembly factor BamD [Gammaproteobacteria bacterium]